MLQAQREGVEIVICDTSGRLHTNVSLMDELAKCKRAITKRMASAPHEVLLVLDGTTGGAASFCCTHASPTGVACSRDLAGASQHQVPGICSLQGRWMEPQVVHRRLQCHTLIRTAAPAPQQREA